MIYVAEGCFCVIMSGGKSADAGKMDISGGTNVNKHDEGENCGKCGTVVSDDQYKNMPDT